MFIDHEKRKAKERAQEFLGQLNDISEELNSIFKDHFPEATSQVRHYGVLDIIMRDCMTQSQSLMKSSLKSTNYTDK